jgi:hypothetical protein
VTWKLVIVICLAIFALENIATKLIDAWRSKK